MAYLIGTDYRVRCEEESMVMVICQKETVEQVLKCIINPFSGSL